MSKCIKPFEAPSNVIEMLSGILIWYLCDIYMISLLVTLLFFLSILVKSVNGNVKPLPANPLQEDEVQFSLYYVELLEIYLPCDYNHTWLQTQLGDYVPDDWRDQGVDQATSSEPEDATLSLSDLQKKKWNVKRGWRDEDQISACPHCHLALPVNTLLWHEVRTSYTSRHGSWYSPYYRAGWVICV